MGKRISKKDVAVWKLTPATSNIEPSDSDLDQEAWRTYLFALAEARFPARFAALKRRVLPVYSRYLSGNNPVYVSRFRSHIQASVELERRIEDWVRKLGLIGHQIECSDPNPDSLRFDQSIRKLTMKRVHAWYANEPWPLLPAIGGIPPLVIAGLQPGEQDKDFRRRVRIATNQYLKSALRWRADRAYKHHFDWLLRHKVGGESLAQIGQSERRHQEASVVFRGIQRAAMLAGLPS